MKNYYRIMPGRGGRFSDECSAGGFIGVDFGFTESLAGNLPDEWREFNRRYIPVYLETHPEKTKVAAGLSCGFTWTVCKGLLKHDIVLSPDGSGRYLVGEITGDYSFEPGQNLPHRRPVRWFDQTIERSEMSEPLRNSSGSIGTVCNLTKYADEIASLIGDTRPPALISTDQTVEDPTTFALEQHLEEFLVRNWSRTELGITYDIFEEDGEVIGQQYQTDTGPLDILARSKDHGTLLVVELKRGRASDVVVGQVARYMGYVKEELAEPGQHVKGVIIALEDDVRLQRALAIIPDVEFYRYQVSFKLVKA